MNQKNVYDHLADIYLDTSKNTKTVKNEPKIEQKKEPEYKQEKHPFNIYKLLFLISMVIVCGLLLFYYSKKNHALTFESALVLTPEAAKIEFVFEPAQKSIYSIGLDRIDLKKFRSLKFLAKTGNPKDEITLRVELENSFKETSEVYMSTLPGKWKDYTIDLADFKKITDWTSITKVSFILEEWNSLESKGTVFFDDVRLTN